MEPTSGARAKLRPLSNVPPAFRADRPPARGPRKTLAQVTPSGSTYPAVSHRKQIADTFYPGRSGPVRGPGGRRAADKWACDRRQRRGPTATRPGRMRCRKVDGAAAALAAPGEAPAREIGVRKAERVRVPRLCPAQRSGDLDCSAGHSFDCADALITLELIRETAMPVRSARDLK